MTNISIVCITMKIIDLLIMSSVEQFKEYKINSRLEYFKDHIFKDLVSIIILILLYL